MGKQAVDNAKRYDGFYVSVRDLKVVGIHIPEAGHPLEDERAHLPVDMDLVASIRLVGQLVAAKVVKRQKHHHLYPGESVGDMIIVYGRQKWKAIDFINTTDRLYGTKDEIKMKVEVVDSRAGLDDQDLEDILLTENSQVIGDPPLVIAKKAKRYYKHHGQSRETTARLCIILKLTEDRLADYMKLLSAPTEVRKAVEDNAKDPKKGLTPDAALATLRLNPDDRAAVVDAAKKGKAPSAKTVRDLARKSKGIAVMRTMPEIKIALEEVERFIESGKHAKIPDLAREKARVTADTLKWVLSTVDELPAHRLQAEKSARKAGITAGMLGGKR